MFVPQETPPKMKKEDALRIKRYSSSELYNWICFWGPDYVAFAKELQSWEFTGEDLVDLTKEEYLEGFHALKNETVKEQLWQKLHDIQVALRAPPKPPQQVPKPSQPAPFVNSTTSSSDADSPQSKKRKLLEMVERLNKKMKPNVPAPSTPASRTSRFGPAKPQQKQASLESVVAKLSAGQKMLKLFGPPIAGWPQQNNVTHVRYTFDFPKQYQYIMDGKPWVNPVQVKYRKDEDKATVFGCLDFANQAIDILYQQSIGQLVVTDVNPYFANAFDFYTTEVTLEKVAKNLDLFIKNRCSWNVLLDDSGEKPKYQGTINNTQLQKIGLRIYGFDVASLLTQLEARNVRLWTVFGRYLFVSNSRALLMRVKSSIQDLRTELSQGSDAKVYFMVFPSSDVHINIVGTMTAIWTVVDHLNRIQYEAAASARPPPPVPRGKYRAF